jgi:hypothetical protein
MDKIKEYALITVAALAFMLITGVAKADGTDKITEIGQKVTTHISNEVESTKQFQAKSWADAKKQWTSLLNKFIKTESNQ